MSEDDKQKGRTGRKMNRRSAMKTFGVAAGTLAFPYGTISSSLSDEYTGEKVLRQASPKKPLTPSEALALQREAIQRFKDKTGSTDIFGSVAPSDDSDIVSLGFQIGPKTGASVYMGTVPKGSDLSQGTLGKRRSKAAEHVQQAKAANRSYSGTVAASDPGGSTVSGFDTDVASYYIDYDDEPSGSLYDGGVVYEKSVSDEWFYGIDHVHRPNPGANAFSGSSVKLAESSCHHKWGAFDAGSITPHDYYPDSNDNGNFTVDGGIGVPLGATIGVSYDPPNVYRNVQGTPNGTDDFRWNWEHPTLTGQDHTFRPVSAARSYDRATSGISASNRLFELYSMGEWNDREVTTRSIYVYVD
ncbi:hypothetical protein [Haloferax denitrificans]|uniref:hypothetical protein n=1 Tax=Haloferax denitrificans TaxID=35745 RepID=UPI003C6ED7DA